MSIAEYQDNKWSDYSIPNRNWIVPPLSNIYSFEKF